MPVRRNARFQRYLKALPQKARTEIRAALVDGATEITDAQKQLCPVLRFEDVHRTPGALRNSIKFTPGNENLPAYAYLRSKRPTDRQDPELCMIITAGNRAVRYAALVEFGTQPHSVAKGASIKKGRLQDKGPHHPGAHAEPYFNPGYRARKAGAASKVKKACIKAIGESYS